MLPLSVPATSKNGFEDNLSATSTGLYMTAWWARYDERPLNRKLHPTQVFAEAFLVAVTIIVHVPVRLLCEDMRNIGQIYSIFVVNH